MHSITTTQITSCSYGQELSTDKSPERAKHQDEFVIEPEAAEGASRRRVSSSQGDGWSVCTQRSQSG